VACGSSTPEPDAAVGYQPDTASVGVPDTASVKAPDTASVSAPDTASEKAPDATFVTTPDTASVVAPDTAIASSPDAPLADSRPVDTQVDSLLPDTAKPDTQMPDAFDPGPVVPVVVNSANTATFNLANGQWKRFSFPAEAGQIYSISELSGILAGYLGPDATVSPTTFTQKTNEAGVLAFTAPATQTYYLAVAASGGGTSGSFQIADGGKPLALGISTVTVTAPNQDDYTFFRFPILAGKNYRCAIAGAAKSSVGFAVSPKAERASNGQFSAATLGLSSPLPIEETLSATSLALSYTGFCYFFLRVSETMTLTITLTETSP
jgi:hypothetical protein